MYDPLESIWKTYPIPCGVASSDPTPMVLAWDKISEYITGLESR